MKNWIKEVIHRICNRQHSLISTTRDNDYSLTDICLTPLIHHLHLALICILNLDLVILVKHK